MRILLALTLTFAALGYAAAGASDKITICHHTASQANPDVGITASAHSLPAHLSHGDTIGPCPTPAVAPTAASSWSATPAAPQTVVRPVAFPNTGGKP